MLAHILRYALRLIKNFWLHCNSGAGPINVNVADWPVNTSHCVRVRTDSVVPGRPWQSLSKCKLSDRENYSRAEELRDEQAEARSLSTDFLNDHQFQRLCKIYNGFQSGGIFLFQEKVVISFALLVVVYCRLHLLVSSLQRVLRACNKV